MTIQYFILIFLTPFLLQFICCGPNKNPKYGPYRVELLGSKNCDNPSKPFANKPPVVFESVIDNGTLSGTITFLKDTKNMKIKLRSFIMRDGNWKQVSVLNNLDCHGMILHLVSLAMNLKYDRKNCVFFKGAYSFTNLDTNQLMHFWYSNLNYGHLKFRSETYSPIGTFYCKDFETLVAPA